MKVEVLERIVEEAQKAVLRIRQSTVKARAGGALALMFPDKDLRGQIKAWAKSRGLHVAFDSPEKGMLSFES